MNYEYCNGHTHTIKRGDTLYALSRHYRVPLELLLRANPYVDVYNLQPGDTLCIPVKKPEGCRFCLDPFIMGGKTAASMEEAADAMTVSDDGQTSAAMSDGMPSVSPVGNMDTTVSRDVTVSNGVRASNDAGISRDTNVAMSMESISDERLSESRDTEPDENKNQDCDAVDKQWLRSMVTEQGETMATLLEKCDMSLEQFFKKNSCKDVALLPGIVYQR